MRYTFHIETTDGVITKEVDSDLDFTDAPFLSNGLYASSSTTCEENVVAAFWQIVVDSNIEPQDFITVLRAVDENGNVIGLGL